jgi:hypothetical protein
MVNVWPGNVKANKKLKKSRIRRSGRSCFPLRKQGFRVQCIIKEISDCGPRKQQPEKEHRLKLAHERVQVPGGAGKSLQKV